MDAQAMRRRNVKVYRACFGVAGQYLDLLTDLAVAFTLLEFEPADPDRRPFYNAMGLTTLTLALLPVFLGYFLSEKRCSLRALSSLLFLRPLVEGFHAVQGIRRTGNVPMAVKAFEAIEVVFESVPQLLCQLYIVLVVTLEFEEPVAAQQYLSLATSYAVVCARLQETLVLQYRRSPPAEGAPQRTARDDPEGLRCLSRLQQAGLFEYMAIDFGLRVLVLAWVSAALKVGALAFLVLVGVVYAHRRWVVFGGSPPPGRCSGCCRVPGLWRAVLASLSEAPLVISKRQLRVDHARSAERLAAAWRVSMLVFAPLTVLAMVLGRLGLHADAGVMLLALPATVLVLFLAKAGLHVYVWRPQLSAASASIDPNPMSLNPMNTNPVVLGP